MFAKSFQLRSCMLWEYEYWVRCFMQRLVRKEKSYDNLKFVYLET